MCAFYVRNVKVDLLLRVLLVFCVLCAVGLMHVSLLNGNEAWLVWVDGDVMVLQP